MNMYLGYGTVKQTCLKSEGFQHAVCRHAEDQWSKTAEINTGQAGYLLPTFTLKLYGLTMTLTTSQTMAHISRHVSDIDTLKKALNRY